MKPSEMVMDMKRKSPYMLGGRAFVIPVVALLGCICLLSVICAIYITINTTGPISRTKIMSSVCSASPFVFIFCIGDLQVD
jgi:hypothetical protein